MDKIFSNWWSAEIPQQDEWDYAGKYSVKIVFHDKGERIIPSNPRQAPAGNPVGQAQVHCPLPMGPGIQVAPFVHAKSLASHWSVIKKYTYNKVKG